MEDYSVMSLASKLLKSTDTRFMRNIDESQASARMATLIGKGYFTKDENGELVSTGKKVPDDIWNKLNNKNKKNK